MTAVEKLVSERIAESDPDTAAAFPHPVVFAFRSALGLDAYGRGVCAKMVTDWCRTRGIPEDAMFARTFEIQGLAAGWMFAFTDADAAAACRREFPHFG